MQPQPGGHNFNPQPLRRSWLELTVSEVMSLYISIHSLFAEADIAGLPELDTKTISIHSLFAEADAYRGGYTPKLEQFQSTASSQKLTPRDVKRPNRQLFQSTASSQKLTGTRVKGMDMYFISIHSLFAEADAVLVCLRILLQDFNPQPLRRSWHNESADYKWLKQFQSTASSQKLTLHSRQISWFNLISIHSLFAEADSKHIQSFHFISGTLYTYCTILSHDSTINCISLEFFHSKSLKKGANPPEFSCSLGIRTYLMKDHS